MKSEIEIDTAAGADAPEVAWPGARQAEWTRLQMLRGPVRDLLALRGRGASALLIGADQDRLARFLLELGVGSVSEDSAANRRYDLVVVASPNNAGRTEGEAVQLACERTAIGGACAIFSRSRLATRDLAREVGFARVSLVQPPADAERSLVLMERCLLIARPAEPAAEEPADG